MSNKINLKNRETFEPVVYFDTESIDAYVAAAILHKKLRFNFAEDVLKNTPDGNLTKMDEQILFNPENYIDNTGLPVVLYVIGLHLSPEMLEALSKKYAKIIIIDVNNYYKEIQANKKIKKIEFWYFDINSLTLSAYKYVVTELDSDLRLAQRIYIANIALNQMIDLSKQDKLWEDLLHFKIQQQTNSKKYSEEGHPFLTQTGLDEGNQAILENFVPELDEHEFIQKVNIATGIEAFYYTKMLAIRGGYLYIARYISSIDDSDDSYICEGYKIKSILDFIVKSQEQTYGMLYTPQPRARTDFELGPKMECFKDLNIKLVNMPEIDNGLMFNLEDTRRIRLAQIYGTFYYNKEVGWVIDLYSKIPVGNQMSFQESTGVDFTQYFENCTPKHVRIITRKLDDYIVLS